MTWAYLNYHSEVNYHREVSEVDSLAGREVLRIVVVCLLTHAKQTCCFVLELSLPMG